jgi:heme-degrading monooxygenase HmoA
MFVNMAFASPRPGKEKLMAESMKAFANALKQMPGLVDTYVLADGGWKTLVGISIWQDRRAFERAMKAVRPPPPPEPAEQLRSAPPVIRQFESI